jgi:aspartate beta-hydroxylase
MKTMTSTRRKKISLFQMLEWYSYHRQPVVLVTTGVMMMMMMMLLLLLSVSLSSSLVHSFSILPNGCIDSFRTQRSRRRIATTITITSSSSSATTTALRPTSLQPLYHSNPITTSTSSSSSSLSTSAIDPNKRTIDEITSSRPTTTGSNGSSTTTKTNNILFQHVQTQNHQPQLSPHTFAGMVERQLMERFAKSLSSSSTTTTTATVPMDDSSDQSTNPHPVERILQSWRLLEQDYIHQEYLDRNNNINNNINHNQESTDKNMSYQLCHSYVPGLTIREFWNVSQFDWCQRLASQYESIRHEFLSVIAHPEYLQQQGNNVWATALDPQVAQQYGSGWSTLVLMNRGMWDVQNVHLFPITSQILYDCHIPAVEIFFASMQPNSTIPYHSDYTNFVLTSHLGIDIPHNGQNQCRLNIGGTAEEEWLNGKVMIFDTSIMHNAVNDSPDQVRYILMMRIWHPDLTDIEQQALQYIYDILEFPELITATASSSSSSTATDLKVRIQIEQQIQQAKSFPLLSSSSPTSSNPKTRSATATKGGFGTTTTTKTTTATKRKPKKK